MSNREKTRSTTTPSTLGEKMGELWSTNKRVLGAHIDPPESTFFGRLAFQIFYTRLEIEPGYLPHTPPGGGSPKNFSRENLKFALKFSMCPYNFGASGSILILHVVLGYTFRSHSPAAIAVRGISTT